MSNAAVRVIVSDPETGEVLGEQVIEDDYVLVCAGKRYLKSTQVVGSTHTLHVAWDGS